MANNKYARTGLNKTAKYTPPPQRSTQIGGATSKRGSIRPTKMYGSR